MNKTLEATITDAVELLSKATNRQVSYNDANLEINSGNNSIRLFHAANQRNQLGTQGFIIKSENAHSVKIIANTSDALSYGLYHYLELLGFRFYMPGENWTIIPELNTIIKSVDKEVVPAFSLRNFFGSFGLAPPTLADPNGQAKKDWKKMEEKK